MGMLHKAMEKAMASLDVEDMLAQATAQIYASLEELGHPIQGTYTERDQPWDAGCTTCTFWSKGNSGGKKAVDAMASVHLGQVNGRG